MCAPVNSRTYETTCRRPSRFFEPKYDTWRLRPNQAVVSTRNTTACPHATLDGIYNALSKDPRIDWGRIKDTERQRPDWIEVANSPKYYIIRRYTTPNRFAHGGDRVSAGQGTM